MFGLVSRGLVFEGVYIGSLQNFSAATCSCVGV